MKSSRLFSRLADLPRSPYLVTVGTFDGMHLGHQHLLARSTARSAELGHPTLVVTFEPTPAQVLRPQLFEGRLSSVEDKRRLIEAAGDVVLAVLPFTAVFACTSADEFLDELTAAVSVVELWVGEEFALGKDRAGSVEHLRRRGAALGFEVTALPRISIDGDIVSSSRIRSLIRIGDVSSANQLLGRRFSVQGEVCEGARLGRTIGFPTANVLPPDDLINLADGIYASWARLGAKPELLPAMTYIGTRPALNPGSRVIETHLFDFDRDIYGEHLATEFVRQLRPDANFESVDALVAQMKRDELQARSILSKDE